MDLDDLVLSGYNHPDYANSFIELGAPLELPRSKGWILKRIIPDTQVYDAMGCYPMFACQNWSELFADLDEIGEKLVAVSLVTDPFGEYDEEFLWRCFKDVVKEFKEHYVIDLQESMNSFVSKHHRRYARKALSSLKVERCQYPPQVLEEWICLYDTLVDRHNIAQILRFSRSSFLKQLSVPGIVVFRAVYEKSTVGILLWYVQGEVGYYHLGAFSNDGYKLRASFALFWTAIDYFKSSGLRWLNLGAGAGVTNNNNDGLSRFKQGWSTQTRTAYFCGRIFNDKKYRDVTRKFGDANTDYFPVYRKGEF